MIIIMNFLCKNWPIISHVFLSNRVFKSYIIISCEMWIRVEITEMWYFYWFVVIVGTNEWYMIVVEFVTSVKFGFFIELFKLCCLLWIFYGFLYNLELKFSWYEC